MLRHSVRVLVTGANGFLGARVVWALRVAGARPLAQVRPGADTSALDGQDVPVPRREAHLKPSPELSAACADVDVVVHCAGGGIALDDAAIDAANVGTTRALLASLPSATRRVVLVSSIAARPEPGEDEPPSRYGRSKAEAERLVVEWASGAPDREAVIVRPPAVYGPGDWRMTSLFRAASHGWAPLPATLKTLSLVHVDDCARALSTAALATPPPDPGVPVYPAGPTPLTPADLASLLGEALGRNVRVLPLPGSLLRAAAVVSQAIGQLRGRPLPLTRDKAKDLLRASTACDPKGLSKMGWEPREPLLEGFVATARSYGLIGRFGPR